MGAVCILTGGLGGHALSGEEEPGQQADAGQGGYCEEKNFMFHASLLSI
jgi:hypothetical protein